MQKLSLILVFVSGGLASVMPLILSKDMIETLRFPDRVFYVPALLFGVMSWLRLRTMGRTWPVLACLTISLLGVAAVDATERGRGLLIFAGLAAAVPISSLIVEQRALILCVKVFIGATALNMILLITESGGMLTNGRFGNLVVEDARVSNPNAVAAQLGFAAVLILVLLQRESRLRSITQRIGNSLTKQDAKLLLLALFFGIGIFFSASRGAIVTMSCLILLVIASSASKLAYRILGCFGLSIGTFLLVSTDNSIISRFEDTSGVVELGDRLPIWKEAFQVSQSSFSNRWFGVGTGGTEKALAESSIVDLSARRGEDGVLRKATHNSYVEWLLSHGLVGVAAAASLLFLALRNAFKFDAMDSSNDRRLLLAYCLIISMVTALYRSTFATPLCAILLAMLSGPLVVRSPNRKRTTGARGSSSDRAPFSQENNSCRELPIRGRSSLTTG